MKSRDIRAEKRREEGKLMEGGMRHILRSVARLVMVHKDISVRKERKLEGAEMRYSSLVR